MKQVEVVRSDDGVVRVTLNRPEARNALSKAVNERLVELAAELSKDSNIRAVVLSGAGDKAFCAGADLKERKGVSAQDSGPFIDAISGAINAWGALPFATIAAMNGSAFGGGLELALACDFRVAVEDATFGLTEVRLGILPGAGGTQRLPRLIGVARAKELILLGRRIDAARGLEIGLLNRVVPREQLDGAVNELVDELRGCAPISVARAKEAIEVGVNLPLERGLEVERRCYDVTLFTEDRNEGLRAFAERRPPEYRGR